MSAKSMPAAPAVVERQVRRAKGSFHLHSLLIFAALASAGAPTSVGASSTGEPVMIAQAGAARPDEDTERRVKPSGGADDAVSESLPEAAREPMQPQYLDPMPSSAMPVPERDQVSAADRLRVDPLETVPVPAAATTRAQPPFKLTKDERAIASHITRNYRVDNGASEQFVHYAYKAAREFRLDPHLILAVMAVESSFDPNASSTAGAKGLMQVHLKVHSRKFEPFGGPDAAYDPPANIKVGAGILSEYVSRYGDVAAGLKAYVGAALLPTDGGYGSKVLNRQAQFNAVLKSEAASSKEPKPVGPVDAGSSQASGSAETPEVSSEAKSSEPNSSRTNSMEANSSEANSSEANSSGANTPGANSSEANSSETKSFEGKSFEGKSSSTDSLDMLLPAADSA